MKALIFAVSLVAACSGFAAPDPVFDVAAITAVPLNPTVLKSSERDGLVTEEVIFHAEDDGAKSVDIFGIFVYPKGAVKAPAFIWNQGGLAKASSYFPELGAKRGYATLCIDFPMPGYRSTGGYPIVSGLEVGDDPRQAPIYHGAVALLQAVTYLQSRPEVDPERIGMAGSSWGGFYTTLMAGVDSRLKAASAMFGTGSLQLGNAWWDGAGASKKDAAARERWRTTLDPAWRLATSHVPIAWFTGTNDHFYWLPAVSKTYELAAGPKHLTLFPEWNHALPEAGDEQVFRWLDAHLKGGKPFPTVSPLEFKDGPLERTVSWRYESSSRYIRGEIQLSLGDSGNWEHRFWSSIPATLWRGVCSVKLPAYPVPYYISGTCYDESGDRYSTPLQRVDPAEFAAPGKRDAVSRDGAHLWGDFDLPQAVFCERRGVRLPEIKREDPAGPGWAQCPAGATTTLPPLLYLPGYPHRMTLSLRTSAPARVEVAVVQGFPDASPLQRETATVETSTTQRDVAILLTPRAVDGASVQITVTLPKDVTGELGSVRFRLEPIPPAP